MSYKLFAFDLDGTLLTSNKELSEANKRALREMKDSGGIVALASGRLGSSVTQIADQLGFEPALLTLNGAAVYAHEPTGYRQVYSALLGQSYAHHLLQHAAEADFALNFYSDGKLFSCRNGLNAQWIDLYYAQTRTACEFVDSLDLLKAHTPNKIIFVGEPSRLDREEKQFRRKWADQVYIVRTWDYYLEFLSLQANKAKGLAALAAACGVDLKDVVAFGDADNDIPMLEVAGLGIAMSNATTTAKNAAAVTSRWSNDEDAIAREWDHLKEKMSAAG